MLEDDGLIGNVEGDGHGLASPLADRSRRFLGGSKVDIRHGKLRTGLGKAERNRTAYAASAARDQGGSPVEAERLHEAAGRHGPI